MPFPRFQICRLSRVAALQVFVVVMVFSAGVFAEEPKSWTIQVDPLTTMLGFVHVQVEHVFTPSFSVYAGPSLRFFSTPLLGGEEEDFLGIGAEVGARWYLFGSAPRGWWVLGRGVFAHLSADTSQGEESAFGGYGSVLGGYTWILADWFVLSAGLGGQYLSYRVAEMGPSGFAPAAHSTVGIAF